MRLLAIAAVVALQACIPMKKDRVPFMPLPMIGQEGANSLGGLTCADRDRLARSPAVQTDDEGFTAHVVLVCYDQRFVAHVAYWSKADADANRVTSRVGQLGGGFIQRRAIPYNPETGNNDIFIILKSEDDVRECRIRKPLRGISPLAIADCPAGYVLPDGVTITEF